MIWKPRLVWAGQAALRALASKVMRTVYIGAAVGLAVWLLYANLWQLLQQKDVLPAGVSAENPALQDAMLTTIRQGRTDRTQYTPRSYASYVRSFTVPSTTPTP